MFMIDPEISLSQIYNYFTISLTSVKCISLSLSSASWAVAVQLPIPTFRKTESVVYEKVYVLRSGLRGLQLPTGSDFRRQGFQTVCIDHYKPWLMFNYFQELQQFSESVFVTFMEERPTAFFCNPFPTNNLKINHYNYTY